MATVVTFGNRRIVEPGVYSAIKAKINSAPTDFSYGNVLIIDTGENAGFGGGSGIQGELANNLDSVYQFRTLNEFRHFVKGGMLWDLAEYLFIPDNNADGPQNVFYVKAAVTTAAKYKYTFDNGSFGFIARDEGEVGNGETANASDTEVRKGFGAILEHGTVDPSKYIIKFFEGSFKGVDADGDPYDGISKEDAVPIIVAVSDEFATIEELINWAKNSADFNARFKLDEANTSGSGTITSNDYSNNSDLVLLSGGTDNYTPAAYDAVLNILNEIDFTFALSLKNAENAQSIENTKLTHALTVESEFKKFLFIGGGNNSLQFDGIGGSIESAQYFNSPFVVVVHSGFRVNLPFSPQKKDKSSVYSAAMALGRIAGLQPQVPGTFKTVRVKEWQHQLTQRERERALQAGVLHFRYVPQLGYVINQAINTLQKNTQLYLADGTSPEISIMRIASQLNKEIVLNARPIFIGGNLNISSPADVKVFIEGYLTKKTATSINDNLILRFEKVDVRQTQDYYEVSYCFVANGPLNKMFVTGFILDSNLTA